MDFKTAALGGIAGAVLGVAAVYGLSGAGLLPGRTGDAAIHAYLMKHPQILVDMTNELQAQQQQADDDARQAAVNKLGTKAYFDPRVAFVTGPANAKTTFVEFFDYNCPFCRSSNAVVEKFYQAHKNDVRFAFIEFPIKGQASIDATRISLAARQQPDKYLALHFALMNQNGQTDAATVVQEAKKLGFNLTKLQSDEEADAVSAEIAAAHTLAGASGIDGTPAFIINGKVREGAIDDHVLEQMLKG